MSYRISLSTCWLSHRHRDGYEMVKEITEMGFEYMELSHGISISLIPGIYKALAEKLIKVSSCHNFCPLPPHVTQAAPNIYQPSSPDRRELDLWVRYTMRSIDTTYQVGADRLVTHMGSLFFFWMNPSKKLKALGKQELTGEELEADKSFVKQRDKLLAKMQRAAPKHIRRIRWCLEQVQEHALEKNVTLCAENREGLLELPLDVDTAEFYGEVADLGTTKLWHDTGHAKLKERFGLLDYENFLEENHEEIHGWHLHDASEHGKDHQALGTGCIDFDMIKRYFREDQVYVLELSPRLKKEEVLSSLQYLQKLLQVEPVAVQS